MRGSHEQNGAAVSSFSAAPVARSLSSGTGRATPYSGIKPVSGAAAELRHAPTRKKFEHTVLRFSNSSVSSSPPTTPTRAGSTPLRSVGMEIVDGVCTVAGFVTLCALGVFILIIT